MVQTTCMKNSVWNLFQKYTNYTGIHDNYVSLVRLHETKQKLKDALSCLLHLKKQEDKMWKYFHISIISVNLIKTLIK